MLKLNWDYLLHGFILGSSKQLELLLLFFFFFFGCGCAKWHGRWLPDQGLNMGLHSESNES